MTGTMQAAALELARAGYAVFPCRPNSKQPLHKGSFHDATTDEFQIEAWWTECPEANIAIYPDGSTPRLAVLDVDVRDHGEDGRETLREREEHVPVTKSAWTPSGGMHLLYSLPDGVTVQSSTRRLGPGLDVRSHGGYILVAPSVIDGVTYRWKDKNPVVEASARFIEMSGAPETRHPDADQWLCEEDTPSNIARAKAFLEREVELGRVAVSGQGGNNFTYATAAVLRDFGLSQATAAELLETLWNPHCIPPHEPGWVAQITENAYNHANRPAGTRGTPDPASMDIMVSQATKTDIGIPISELLRWGDIMAMPDPTYLVAGTIPERSLVMVYGAYGVHKTFVGVDLLMAVATGQDWLGLGVIEPGEAVYITPEGVAGFKKRLRAWASFRGLSQDEYVKNVALMKRMPMFGDLAQVQDLYEQLKVQPPKIIFLDTVAHAMAGMDENTQKDAGLFIKRLMDLIDLLGCTIVLIHHTGKDERKGARGASGIPAACDTVFEVTQPSAGVVRVTMTKQKDDERWKKSRFYKVTPRSGSLALAYDGGVLKFQAP